MEKFSTVCRNSWCKATFFYTEVDLIEDEINPEIKREPSFCFKCKSFSNELSGGVEWEERQYEDDPYTSSSFPIKYRVTNFRK